MYLLKKILILSLIVFVNYSVIAKLERSRPKQWREYRSGGLVKLKGGLHKGHYFPPESTPLAFVIPKLAKKDFKIVDETDGKELIALFSDKEGSYYRLDVYTSKGKNAVKDWHETFNKAPRGTYIVEEYIKEEKFDLDKCNIEVPIFMTISNLDQKDNPNGYQVSGMVMANNKVYMITTIVHAKIPKQPHPRGIDVLSQALGESFEKNTGIKNESEEKILTLEEKKIEAKEKILKLLSNLYVWPEGTSFKKK